MFWYSSGGDIYEGEFQNGVYNGQGKYTYANGEILDGVWENGTFPGVESNTIDLNNQKRID